MENYQKMEKIGEGMLALLRSPAVSWHLHRAGTDVIG
jgi:hypothetical protein